MLHASSHLFVIYRVMDHNEPACSTAAAYEGNNNNNYSSGQIKPGPHKQSYCIYDLDVHTILFLFYLNTDSSLQ